MSNTILAVKKITVLGAGSYGTAISYVMAKYNRAEKVVLYCRDSKQADIITNRHINPKRFSKYNLPDNLIGSSNLKSALEGAQLVVLGIPTQYLPEFISNNLMYFIENVPIVCTAKGIHVKSHKLLSEALVDILSKSKKTIPLAFLSGPSFAQEMIKGHPIALTVASFSAKTANLCQKIMSCLHFRLYTSLDVVGVECGGAFKNPMAIGCGIALGLGYGQSTIATIITRSCKEMRELSVALGGKSETLVGLSGIGDLMLSCFSSQSRNNRFGCMIAKGMTIEEAIKEIGEVVEGLPTSFEIVRLADKHNLKMPIFRAIADVLSDKLEPSSFFNKINSSKPGIEMYI